MLWAPPRATRNPVMTSSAIRSAPCGRGTSRSAATKPSSGGTTPMLPATGSTITAAISLPRSANVSLRAAGSLYGRTIVAAEADGRHGRLGATTDEANHLDAGNRGHDRFRQIGLSFGRRSVRRAESGLLLDRPHDGRERMSVDQRSPAHDEVDVCVAVGVPDLGAVAAPDEEWRPTDSGKRANGAVNAAGNHLAGAVKELRRAAHRSRHRARHQPSGPSRSRSRSSVTQRP